MQLSADVFNLKEAQIYKSLKYDCETLLQFKITFV